MLTYGADSGIAESLIDQETRGAYHLTENNCQHYATELLGRICQETNYGETRASKASYRNQGSAVGTISLPTLLISGKLQTSATSVSRKKR
jgi:hypothetical protein